MLTYLFIVLCLLAGHQYISQWYLLGVLPGSDKRVYRQQLLERWRTSLKVPSTYHVLARARMVSCSCLANSRWRLSFTSMSARRKPSGIQSSTNSKSRSLGCSGRSFWRRRLAARAMYSGLGRAAHGASASSSSRTYQ